MKISFQIDKIKASMEMDKKDPFQRITKLLEEQGELFESYFQNCDLIDSIEEAIDNLLVTISIAYVIDKDSLQDMENLFNLSIKDYKKSLVETEMINLAISSGRIADSVQKYLKVGASIYKGSMSKDDTLLDIEKSILIISKILNGLLEDMDFDKVSYINSIIDKKNSKWLEKSIIGQKQKI